MAETTDINIDFLGKKIFFVNPTPQIKNYVVANLRNDELEVYLIDSYKLAKNVLLKNPNSLCFFYVDSDLTLNGWITMLCEITKSPELQSNTIGVISDKIGDKEKLYLLENAVLLGGIHKAGSSPLRLLSGLKDVVKTEKAKGRRQYVRANCLKEKNNELVWPQNNTVMQLKIVDISTTSIALKAKPEDVPFLQKGTKVTGATLRLGVKQYLVDFLIYDIHQRDGKTLVVALFMQESLRALKLDVQEYVYEVLQKQLMDTIELLPPDEREYNKIGKSLKFSKKKSEEENKDKAEKSS